MSSQHLFNTAYANAVVNAQIANAWASVPKTKMTIAAVFLNSLIGLILAIPLAILVIPTTMILALLVHLSFGMLLLIFSLVWLPVFALLLGSSWLWLKIPLLRPILLVPGLVIARIGFIYTSLVPDMGEKHQKAIKLALCDQWPITYRLLQAEMREPGGDYEP